MMRGAEFVELRAFVAVASERSFRRAATRLGVSPSALSHTIRALEDRLGARLLHRTTRSVALTEAGASLLARLTPALAELEAAVNEIGVFSARPRGRLRINLPRLAADTVLAPRLGRFAQLYPEIVLDLVVEDSLTDIVAGGFDAGVRPADRVQGDMIAVRLSADLRAAVVASPEYVASHGAPSTPDDLRHHRCINYRWTHNGSTHRWRFELDGQASELTIESPLTINDTHLIIAAAIGGAGFAYILQEAVADYITAGRLVRVLERWCQPTPGFHLYYSGRRHVSAPLRAFIEFFRYPSSADGPAP